MSDEVALHVAEPWPERLDLPAYRVADAARYCGLSARIVRAWIRDLLGGDVVPRHRRRHAELSYYRLVEVAFVGTFVGLGVPLWQVRRVRELASDALKSEHPFAQESWRTEGHWLLHDVEGGGGLRNRDDLVSSGCCQGTGWIGSMRDRFDQFDYEYGLALVWHLAGRGNPVSVDPRVSFGAPMVRGIPTSILRGRWEAGETPSEIREDFDLTMNELLHALDFEGIPVEVNPEGMS